MIKSTLFAAFPLHQSHQNFKSDKCYSDKIIIKQINLISKYLFFIYYIYDISLGAPSKDRLKKLASAEVKQSILSKERTEI